jgi:hypothetical protein
MTPRRLLSLLTAAGTLVLVADAWLCLAEVLR